MMWFGQLVSIENGCDTSWRWLASNNYATNYARPTMKNKRGRLRRTWDPAYSIILEKRGKTERIRSTGRSRGHL